MLSKLHRLYTGVKELHTDTKQTIQISYHPLQQHWGWFFFLNLQVKRSNKHFSNGDLKSVHWTQAYWQQTFYMPFTGIYRLQGKKKKRNNILKLWMNVIRVTIYPHYQVTLLTGREGIFTTTHSATSLSSCSGITI